MLATLKILVDGRRCKFEEKNQNKSTYQRRGRVGSATGKEEAPPQTVQWARGELSQLAARRAGNAAGG